MTISYIGNSAMPAGSTGAIAGAGPLVLAYPAHVAGDVLVLFVGLKPNTATVTTPAGWTAPANGTANGGAGTTGIDTGPTKVAAFERTSDGSLTGNFNVTLGSSPNVAWGIVCVARSTISGVIWSVAAASGVDATGGTPFTTAMGTDPGIAVGDLLLVAGVIPTDITTPAQFSAETITGSGITTAVTEIGEPDTGLGNDLGGLICRATVSAGPSSGAPTFSATAGGTTTNVTGPIVLVRLRETSNPTIAPTAATATASAPIALLPAPIRPPAATATASTPSSGGALYPASSVFPSSTLFPGGGVGEPSATPVIAIPAASAIATATAVAPPDPVSGGPIVTPAAIATAMAPPPAPLLVAVTPPAIATAVVATPTPGIAVTGPVALATAQASPPTPKLAIPPTAAQATATAGAPVPELLIPVAAAVVTASAPLPNLTTGDAVLAPAATATATAVAPQGHHALQATVAQATATASSPTPSLRLFPTAASATAAAPASVTAIGETVVAPAAIATAVASTPLPTLRMVSPAAIATAIAATPTLPGQITFVDYPGPLALSINPFTRGLTVTAIARAVTVNDRDAALTVVSVDRAVTVNDRQAALAMSEPERTLEMEEPQRTLEVAP